LPSPESLVTEKTGAQVLIDYAALAVWFIKIFPHKQKANCVP